MFDWKSFSLNMLKLAPLVVAGVEQIHTDASGATKQQLAQESLLLASGVANAVLPEDQKQIANVVAPQAANLIDAITAMFNATGIFQHKTAPAKA